MDYKKLKIDRFNKIAFFNFKDKETAFYDTYEVVIFKINALEDIQHMVDKVENLNMAADNRVIMVYEKGQKTINRDSIIRPFKNGEYLDYKMKAPMLCSLDKVYSAFVLMKENTC